MVIKCKICTREFYIRPSDIKRGRDCCSSKCGHIKRKKLRGNEHPNWKGDNVGYAALHYWMKKRLIKPKKCQNCRKIKPHDLANKGIYNRDLKNWWYLCRRCHMQLDGRMEKLIINGYKGRETRWGQKQRLEE